MPRVEIYTARHCPYCRSAKALLAQKGVRYEEIDISGNWERRDEMIVRSQGRVTVPQILVDGEPLGGSDELYALDRDGRLDAILSGRQP